MSAGDIIKCVIFSVVFLKNFLFYIESDIVKFEEFTGQLINNNRNCKKSGLAIRNSFSLLRAPCSHT